MQKFTNNYYKKFNGFFTAKGAAETYHSRHLKAGLLFLTCAFCLSALGFLTAGNATGQTRDDESQSITLSLDEPEVETTREALKQWIEIQDNISKEKRDFLLSKEMLNQRIKLYQREIGSLHDSIKGAKESITDADKKLTKMQEENQKLIQASQSLHSTLEQLENRTRELVKRLPDPIRERIKPLSQQLPENSDESKISQAQRFQNVVGILNEVDKFNRDITVTSEVRELEDGSSVEVTAIYIGIGQALYATANGSVAGIGTASPEGWAWIENNDAAPQITSAIKILRNEQVATFVQVPVEIN